MHQRCDPNNATLSTLICYLGGQLVNSTFQTFAIKNETKEQSPKLNKESKKTEINNHRYIHSVDLCHITNESVWRVTITLSSNYGNKTVGVIPVKCIHLIVRARRMNLLMNSMKDSGGDEITTRS